MTKQIVVLASGSGSNFQSIIDAVERGDIDADIRALVVDRLCTATERAAKHGINFFVVNRKNDKEINQRVLSSICQGADLIVCAGYLSIIPSTLIAEFPQKIINIHPSLLPKFGGMGMFGMNIHKAVIAAGEAQSGCTVHFVDSGVDTGEIIKQTLVDIDNNDSAQSLQQKILVEEHKLLPAVIAQLLS